MSSYEDPDKMILLWMTHLTVPSWDESESSSCAHCELKLVMGSRHHCRLCGLKFCSQCVAHYYVLSQFQKFKKDSDPCPVCFACRDKCLSIRDKALKKNRVEPRRVRFIVREVEGKHIVFAPIAFASETEYSNCFLCNAPSSKRKHCRVCGERFCHDCISKCMELPIQFREACETKSLVCNECRFILTTPGYVLERFEQMTELFSVETEIKSSSSGLKGFKEKVVGAVRSKSKRSIGSEAPVMSAPTTPLSMSVKDFSVPAASSLARPSASPRFKPLPEPPSLQDSFLAQPSTYSLADESPSFLASSKSRNLKKLSEDLAYSPFSVQDPLKATILEHAETRGSARVLYDYKPKVYDQGIMSLQEGDELRVLKFGESGWWLVANDVKIEIGWAPSNYLVLVDV